MWAFRDIPLPVARALLPYTPVLSGLLFSFFSIFQVVHPAVVAATEAMKTLVDNDKQIGQQRESIA